MIRIKRSLIPYLREAAECRHMAGEFLHRGQEKLLCETLKMNPGLHWRVQDDGRARVLGCLPVGEACKVWNQPKRECAPSVKLKGKSL